LSETKKYGRRLKSAQERPASNLFSITNKQKNEAVGLMIIGIAAFLFSLLYYLGKSKIGGIASFFAVYFGLGIYLFPVFLLIIGFQYFINRSFENYLPRIIGVAFSILLTLGLLDLEGGKIGVQFFAFFARRFGEYPSKILFFFALLSSMIFALDILYKDFLEFIVILLHFVFRLFRFVWELCILLLVLGLDAWKTTVAYLYKFAFSFLSIFQHQESLVINESGRLLSFDSINMNVESSNSEIKIDKAVTQKSTELSTGGVLLPEKSEKIQTDDLNREQDGLLQMSNSVPILQVTNISTQICIPSITNSLDPLDRQRTFYQKENSGNEFVEKCEKVNEEKPIILDKSISNGVDNTNEHLEEIEVQNSVMTIEESMEKRNSPESLDDHPIDRDLKKDNLDARSFNKPIFSEALLPPVSLLSVVPPRENENAADLSERSELLLKTLSDFGIQAQITDIVMGPAVSRFELKPGLGVKVSRISSLADDLALALSAPSIRIEAPIPGKPALGIEIPNPKPMPVYFYDLVKNERFQSKETILNLALGVTISGRPVFADLTEMPHLLIAGTTGSGKSVCINTIIASILFQARADQVKMVMIDPKLVELSSYTGIPHLISPVVTDPKKASAALLWAVEEMERRYELLAGCGIRKISTYNEELPRLRREIDPDLEQMPFIVIIIDELADLMMTASAEVERSICRLAQMARAVGIHLVIATQRPSVDVLTGIIKANLPSRIAFAVASHVDSRTILDTKGAERLLGKGDMLFVPKGRNKPLRLQGAFISDKELYALTEYVKSQGKPDYMEIAPANGEKGDDVHSDEEVDDPGEDEKLMNTILDYLSTQEKTSTSMLQRKFKIGYNRAARIMDMLEEKGLVSPLDGSNKRRVLGKRSSS